jgi:hypothetical protein
MRRGARIAAQLLLTSLLLAAVVVLGQWPMGESTGEAVLRISLRTTRAKAEVCRDRTPEELESLPVHMREARICAIFAPAYRLTVAIDGELRLERVIAPGGVQGDRPLIAGEELRLPPGASTVEIAWVPVAAAGGEAVEPDGLLPGLPRFTLSERVEFVADRIALVELDEGSGELRLIGTG